MTTPLPEPLLTRLRSAKNVLILTHQRPDPDALGSQSALALILHKLGTPHITLYNYDPVPAPYAFLQANLPSNIQIEARSKKQEARKEGETLSTQHSALVPHPSPSPQPPEGATRNEKLETRNPLVSGNWKLETGNSPFDLIVTVDTCTYSQMEPLADFLKAHHEKIIALDHHLSRDPIGPLLHSDTSAAACTEIILDVALQLPVPLDAAIATRLMAGLVADTGWFRFDSVTPRTHRAASILIEAGAQPAELYERLNQNETKPKLALIQRALASLQWAANDRIALMTLTQRDFADAGATQSQTEDIINLPLMVGSLEVIALLAETPDGRTRCSLRSKHAIDVNQICRQFNGGGHAKAAGCRLPDPPAAARTHILNALLPFFPTTA